MLFRESVTTAIHVKCHLLARHVNGCPLLQVFSALSVCVWVSPRLELKDWMMEVHTGVCVSTVNQGERGVGKKKKKSIDPRLHSDHLPLPSNGLTPWPPKVCRQLSRIACRQTVCQRQALLHKFLSFFFLFSNLILAKWSYAASLQKRENKKLLCPLTNRLRGSDGGYTLVKKKQKQSFPCSSQADTADKAGGGEARGQTGRQSETSRYQSSAVLEERRLSSRALLLLRLLSFSPPCCCGHFDPGRQAKTKSPGASLLRRPSS